MKPAPFDYYRPGTLDEAVQLLAQCGDEGKLLAGGQSLVPILNMRLAVPQCLIDINALEELSYVRVEDDWLKIGSLTRQRQLEVSTVIRNKAPLLAEAIPFIGHMQTRNRGTIGGSLVHADPTAELALSCLALDSVAVITSSTARREVNLRDFFLTFLTTDVAQDEVLTEIKLPIGSLPDGSAFTEYSRRHGDFALVDTACVLDVDDSQQITDVRLVVGGVDAVPVLVEDVAAVLIGEQLSNSLLKKVGEIVVLNVDPESDLHASREYRLHLARVFAEKTLETAYGRATERGKHQ